MSLFLVLLLLALVLGGLGFFVHVLWIAAVMLLVLWLASIVLRGGDRSQRRR